MLELEPDFYRKPKRRSKTYNARTFNLHEHKNCFSLYKNLFGLMAEKSRQELATMLLDVPKTGGRGGGTYIYLLSLLQVPPEHYLCSSI